MERMNKTEGQREIKRKVGYILWMIFGILLCACGKKEPTWQEQYDLGMKYLNTEDYEEAVTAFQVAISIDPKQQPAYIGAADAYVGMAGVMKLLRKTTRRPWRLTKRRMKSM